MTDSTVKCAQCAAQTDTLALFPGGICVDCYAASPAGRAPLTAAGVSRMFGRRVLNHG